MPGLLVSEVAEAADVSIETIRFYQNEGLLPLPERPDRGYRKYSKDFVHRLRFIRSARELGLSLCEIHDILQVMDSATMSVSDVGSIVLKKMDRIKSELQRLRAQLTILEALNRLLNAHDGSGRKKFQKAMEVFNTWVQFT